MSADTPSRAVHVLGSDRRHALFDKGANLGLRRGFATCQFRKPYRRIAEIDLDGLELAALEHQALGVPKPVAGHGLAIVEDEGFVAVLDDPFEVVHADSVAVGPAPFEVGRPVDLVVVGASEREVVAQELLHHLSVF